MDNLTEEIESRLKQTLCLYDEILSKYGKTAPIKVRHIADSIQKLSIAYSEIVIAHKKAWG